MNEWLMTIGGGLLLSIIHIIAPKLEHFIHGKHAKIMSLSAGMFLAYIFLEALKIVFEAHVEFGIVILILLFGGFALYHAFSKYLYQHTKDRKKLEVELDELLYVGSAADSMFAGFALAIILDINEPVYFALIPFVLHTFSATLSFQMHHSHFKTPKILQSLLAFSPLLGAVIGQAILLETGAFHYLFAFVTGAILYISIRHTLPEGEKGNLIYFIAGAVIGVLLLIL